MSSVTQVQGDSQRRQVEAAEDYAAQHGLRLAPPMRDLGISAFKGRHRKSGALGLFLQAIKDGEVSPGTLIIEAVDRLSREPPLTIMKLLTEILEAGFVIHILTTRWTIDLETLNRSSWLLNAVVNQAQLAHSESVLKSDRIAKAYVNRRREAREGKVLKGNYHPAWLRREYLPTGEVRHYVIEEVADAVRMVFELADTGLGAHSIAKILNERKVPVVPACLPNTEAGRERQERRRWYQAYTGRLLLDRRVLGEYQPKTKTPEGKSVNEGDPIPGHYPQIINDELWSRVQANKNPKHGRKAGVRNLGLTNLLTDGLARCAHCEGNMLVRADFRKEGKTGRSYLRCAANQQGSTCDNRRMPRYEWFEAKLLTALPGLPWADLLRKDRGDDPVTKLRATLAEIDVEAERKQAAMDRLVKVLEEDAEPIPGISKRIRALQSEIKDLYLKHGGYQAELNALQVARASEDGITENLAALLQAMDTEDRIERLQVRQKVHQILKRVVKRAWFSSDGMALVHLRGGMVLEIPFEKDGTVLASYTMGEAREFMQQTLRDGIPPLTPNEDQTAIVAQPARA